MEGRKGRNAVQKRPEVRYFRIYLGLLHEKKDVEAMKKIKNDIKLE